MPRKHKWKDEFMAVCAFRYCLGRQTGAPARCMDWLAELWPDIHGNAQITILSEIAIALARGDLTERSMAGAWDSFGHMRYRWLDANGQAMVQQGVKPLVKRFPW